MALTQEQVEALSDPALIGMKASVDAEVAARPEIPLPPIGYPKKRKLYTSVFAIEDNDKALLDAEDALRSVPPPNVSTLRQRIQSSDNNTIQIRWSRPPAGNTTEVSDDNVTYTASASDNQHNFTGLDAATTYTAYVRHVGRGARMTGTASSLEVYTAPDLQTGLADGGKTSTTITVTWTEDPADGVSYELRINSGSWVDVARGTNTNTFIGLTANSNNDIELRGVYNGVPGGTVSISITTSA